ncbi:hypothetical protein EON77_00990, partial [bacterium]
MIDGALEVRGRIGQIRVVTSGGFARLTVPGAVPAAVAYAAIGRPASDLVAMAALRGRDWPVIAIEISRARGGSTFV